ncbi:hypothetical protein LR48_Vigan267s000400 [Vigna angularis]|uniref:CCHC-type domain-containing protein n=1 Tax=Phaseolus angularis TaxID=3914 RepID=A0A0L9T753_PHAAN|nr:hypothetical protein LR48_Vigan267s000400 [Vigna angularis]
MVFFIESWDYSQGVHKVGIAFWVGKIEKLALCVSKVGAVLFKLTELLLPVRASKEALPVRLSKEGSSSSFKCYGCGERGHVKAYCSSNKRSKERKEKKIHKKKKVHIAWEDNASTTSSSSDSVEETNLCLTANVDDTASQEKLALCVSKVGAVLFKLTELLLLVRASKEALSVRLSKEGVFYSFFISFIL